MSGLILPAIYTHPRLKDPRCEYTAPGSQTEAIDCQEGPRGTRARATRRHVSDDGRTLGLFCDLHNRPGPIVATVEYVPSLHSGLVI